VGCLGRCWWQNLADGTWPFRVDLRTRLRQCDVRQFMQCDPVAVPLELKHGWWAAFQSGKSILRDSVDGLKSTPD